MDALKLTSTNSLARYMCNIALIVQEKNEGDDRGYRLGTVVSTGNRRVSVMPMMLADDGDVLQSFLHSIYLTVRIQYSNICTKTLTLVILKEPLKCKIDVNDKTVEQLMSLPYLGMAISACQNCVDEVRAQDTDT